MTSSGHRNPENRSDFAALADFPWRMTWALQPLRKIDHFDLMFDAHFRDGHLHSAEPFLDTFHPFVLAQCRQPLRHCLEE